MKEVPSPNTPLEKGESRSQPFETGTREEPDLHSRLGFPEILLERLSMGVCRFSIDTGIIEDVNQPFCHYLGTTRSRLIGSKAVDCLAETSRTEFSTLIQRLSSGESTSGVMECQTISNEAAPCWFHLHLSLLKRSGTPPGAWMILWEITAQKSAEFHLGECEEKYRNLVERARDGIVIIQNERLVYVNPYFAELTGYPPGELEGQAAERIISTDLVNQLIEIYRRRLNGSEEPYICEGRLRCKDGRRTDAEFNIVAIPYNGQPAKLVIVRDITERKKTSEDLQRSEAFIRTILENLAESVFAKDTQCRYSYLNRAYCKTLGLSRDRVIGKTDWEIQPGPFAKLGMASDRFVFEKNRSFHGEIRTTAGDGSRRVFSVVKAPLKNSSGETTGLVGIARNITEQKETEMERIEAERRLRFLSSCLLQAQEAERNRLSKELHDELGQSLALLKHMLRSGIKTSGKESSRLQEAVEYVDHIIENLRRISRDLSPSILEDLGLTAALKWVVETFAKKHGIETAVRMIDIDALFSSDVKINLYRIFQETLNNVAKHARASKVSVTVAPKRDRIRFAIEDNGKGFRSIRSRRGKTAVKGMGLDIISERARMIGATLEVDSTRGKGTRISFSVTPVEKWRVKA